MKKTLDNQLKELKKQSEQIQKTELELLKLKQELNNKKEDLDLATHKQMLQLEKIYEKTKEKSFSNAEKRNAIIQNDIDMKTNRRAIRAIEKKISENTITKDKQHRDYQIEKYTLEVLITVFNK